MMQKQPIPIRTLNSEVTFPQKEHPQGNQQQQIVQQKLVIGAGGFKIPTSVIEEKKKIFNSQVQPLDNKQDEQRLSQLEIYQQLGLKPYQMSSAIKDKQQIAASTLHDQPMVKSQYLASNRRVIQEEREDIAERLQQFVVSDEEEDMEQRVYLDQIEADISKHYKRLDKLENDFMAKELKESYQPDDNVWTQVKQLKEYRKQLKQEQQESREEYEKIQKKNREVKIRVEPLKGKHQIKEQEKVQEKPKDPFIQQQIDEFLKQKEMDKNKPRKKKDYLEDVKPITKEQQIHELNYEEYRKDKHLKKQMEAKAQELMPLDFERYKLKDKPRVDAQITDRAIADVKTLDDFHKIQVQLLKDEQIDQLDIATKKAIFHTLMVDKQQEKNIENQKNELFVLKFSFQQIDKDRAGFVSVGEVLEFMLTNKDIQVIFDLDISTMEQAVNTWPTHRKGMMDFNEFSALIQQLHQNRQKILQEFRSNVRLQEDNAEERLKQQYLHPIREIFKILNYKDEGVVNRLDLIRAIRNELSKKNAKLLNLPISHQSGSPSLNQVLEKIISDYRLAKNKSEIEMMSLKQLEEYFQISMPVDEIKFMQARIIMAHFGPGSIASEGFYNKIKNRCELQHEEIQKLLECFMKIDQNCELIISKKLLVEQIQKSIDTQLVAVRISTINKVYTLQQLIDQLSSTIKDQEGHDSNYISLQQFTDYLTNYQPIQQQLPPLYFVNEAQEKPTQEHLEMHINSLYLQILQDVFDMVPRVFAHFVLKEEFIAIAKNDPQSKCLLQQVGRGGKQNETINTVLNKIQKLEIDFLQWADVVYMFSDKGDIPKEDYTNKLVVKPQQPRGKRLYEKVIQGQVIDEEDNNFVDVENLSFDDGQMKKMKKQYDKFNDKVRTSKSAKRLTVPKEPNFKHKTQTIRQRKLQEMVQQIQEQEEFELQNKFRANPVPLGIFIPNHHERKFNSEKIVPNPPSFYQKDVNKFLERRQKAEDWEKTKEIPKQSFKAKEVPLECNLEVLKQKEIEQKLKKKEQNEKRKAELLTNTKMPQRLLDDELKRKEKKEQQKNLKPSDIDPQCQFNPKTNKNFVSKKEKSKKKPTPEIEYLDEDNRRNKKPESPKIIRKIDLKDEGVEDVDIEVDQQQMSLEQSDVVEMSVNKQSIKSQTHHSGDSVGQKSKKSSDPSQEKSVNNQSNLPVEKNDEQYEPDNLEVRDNLENMHNPDPDAPEEVEEESDQKDQQNSYKQSEVESQQLKQNTKQQNSAAKAEPQKVKEKVQEKDKVKVASEPKKQHKAQSNSNNEGQNPPIQQVANKQEINKKEELKEQEQQSNVKKEKPKPISSQEIEQQRVKAQQEKAKQEKLAQQKNIDPSYRQKMQELQEKMNSKPLMVGSKQHGSKKLDKYRQMAKEASMKKDQGIEPVLDEMNEEKPKQQEAKQENADKAAVSDEQYEFSEEDDT